MNESGWLGFCMEQLLKQAVWDGVFPGVVAGIVQGEGEQRLVWQGGAGWASLFPEKKQMEKDVFFDMASLTKPLATTLALMILVRRGAITLETPLSVLLGREIQPDKKKITVRHLLGHCSGLPAWRPFYERLREHPEHRRKEQLIDAILRESMVSEPGANVLYSDLGFLLLGVGVEIQTGMELDDFVEKEIYMGVDAAEKLMFRPIARGGAKRRFAATEDCPWRKRVLCGEVHDDNCHVLGGVAGHAGLFGTIDGVLRITTLLLDLWKGRIQHPVLSSEMIRYFFTRSGVRNSTWGLGFDTPAATGSSAGRYLSRNSAGHLGFTGTSFWIDPERDLVVVLLTNRVHPSRNNEKIKAFRPIFHDRVVEFLRMV